MEAANIPPGIRTYLGVLSLLWGACIGSFLNVCIYRIPREMSVVHPRSHCPHCNRLIPWYLNIPVLSYLALGGRCRYCRAPIAFRYALVELLTGMLFLMVWLKLPFRGATPFGLTPVHDAWSIPVYWLFAGGLVLGTFVDFEHMIIPDRVTLGGIVAGLVLSPLVPQLHGVDSRHGALVLSLLGAAAGWGTLWAVAKLGSLVFRKEAMGFGDVKLMGAIGAFLGWKAVLFTIMVSSLLGSVAGIALIATGKGRLQSRIPYGPYLSLAALIWVFWGPTLWQAYVDLLLPTASAL